MKLCGGVRICQQALCGHLQTVLHIWQELPNPFQFLADEFLELPHVGGHLPEVFQLLWPAPAIGVEGLPPAHEKVAAPQSAGPIIDPFPDPLVGPAFSCTAERIRGWTRHCGREMVRSGRSAGTRPGASQWPSPQRQPRRPGPFGLSSRRLLQISGQSRFGSNYHEGGKEAY